MVQTESISECTLKDLSNDIWHAYQSWNLVRDEENNIPSKYVSNRVGGGGVCGASERAISRRTQDSESTTGSRTAQGRG